MARPRDIPQHGGEAGHRIRPAGEEPRALGLERVYWFTWATRYGRGGSVFNYAGLQEYRDGKFTAQPALGALQRVARTLQGCEKDAIGNCLPG